MTVTTTTSRNEFACSGAVDYPFNFKILAETDLEVIYRNASGVDTTLVLNTDFTVSTGPWPSGGTVTTVATYSSGSLIVQRSLPYKQLTDYITAGNFPAETHEAALDYAVMLAQQLLTLVNRSFKLADGDTSGASLVVPTPLANALLGWKSDGSGLENKAITDASTTIITTFMATLLDDSSADAALTTLGVAAFAKTLLDDTSAQEAAQTLLINKKGADIASAGALAVGSDGDYFDVTGTTTITSITGGYVGQMITLHFDASLTLTHHATQLILPGSGNITTQAGDEALFIQYSTGNWRCIGYMRASGRPVTDKIEQVVHSTVVTVNSTTTTMPLDDSIPQNTEGAEFINASITPKDANSKLLIEAHVYLAHSAAASLIAALFKDSDANAVQASWASFGSSGGGMLSLRYEMTAGATSAMTFKVRCGSPTAGTTYLNSSSAGSRLFGGILTSNMRITEIRQ